MKGAQDRGEDAVLPRPSPRPLRLPLPLRPRRGRGGRGPKGKRGTGQGHPNAAMGTAPRGDDARTFTPKLGTPPPLARRNAGTALDGPPRHGTGATPEMEPARIERA